LLGLHNFFSTTANLVISTYSLAKKIFLKQEFSGIDV